LRSFGAAPANRWPYEGSGTVSAAPIPTLTSHPAPDAARPKGAGGADATRAVLVGVDLGAGAPFDPSLEELALLAASAGDETVARITARRKAPDPALFVGSGKADEI